MKNLQPIRADTIVDSVTREWIPHSFDGFLQELSHIVSQCTGPNPLPLFRGHSRREWLLDSTFARSCKAAIFDLQPGEKLLCDMANSEELHFALLNLYLLKYGQMVTPHADLEKVARENGIDSWFELMRRYQQYPNEDLAHLKGSNLVDWTKSTEVALYFANLQRQGDGAVYVCDSFATGRTFQIIPVSEVIEKMRAIGNSGKPLGCPLMFHPPIQIACSRADNQQAVYFAQMDLRFDLEDQWRLREKELIGETIVVKLILPAGCEGTVAKYLNDGGITHSFLFPDK